MKELRHSSLIILRNFFLTCYKAEFAFLFLPLYLSFLPRIFTIYRIAGVRRWRLSLYTLSITSIYFMDT